MKLTPAIWRALASINPNELRFQSNEIIAGTPHSVLVIRVPGANWRPCLVQLPDNCPMPRDYASISNETPTSIVIDQLLLNTNCVSMSRALDWRETLPKQSTHIRTLAMQLQAITQLFDPQAPLTLNGSYLSRRLEAFGTIDGLPATLITNTAAIS